MVVLTSERKRHILDGHPEIKDLFPALIRTVRDPDEIHRNKQDPMMVIFWRGIEGQEHYLRVALLLSEGGELHHSIMSASGACGAKTSSAKDGRVEECGRKARELSRLAGLLEPRMALPEG